jgi:phosphatidylglycerol:prolipoprotein diacylglycerol transferase
MINFLHTFSPEPILLSIGPITIYWDGMLIVSGILSALAVALKLAEKHGVSKEKIIDSVFYLVIFGVLGARIYHVLLETGYYAENPLEIFKIWNGGLAIHGGIIAGIISAYFFSSKQKINFYLLLAIYAPALALGQAIGRFGNYFNQELYGLPTSLPWGIPIEPLYRNLEFYNYTYFHPTFLYESLGSLLIFLALLLLHRLFLKKSFQHYEIIIFFYLISYSILRFSLEFIRIDKTPEFLGLRWPQVASLLIIAVIAGIITKNRKKYLPLKNN